MSNSWLLPVIRTAITTIIFFFIVSPNSISKAIFIPALKIVSGYFRHISWVGAEEAVEGGVIVAGAKIVEAGFSVLLLAGKFEFGGEGIYPRLLYPAVGTMRRLVDNFDVSLFVVSTANCLVLI